MRDGMQVAQLVGRDPEQDAVRCGNWLSAGARGCVGGLSAAQR